MRPPLGTAARQPSPGLSWLLLLLLAFPSTGMRPLASPANEPEGKRMEF